MATEIAAAIGDSDAEERLGYAPRYSNRDALIRNYDWFMANRAQFAGGDPGSRGRWPW